MRTLLALLATLGLTASALAQGTVNFNNNVCTGTAAQPVTDFNGVPVAGSDFVAQLYYGGTPYELRPVTNAPARFSISAPGVWSGGTRTLIGFHAGDMVWLQVRVWNASLFPSYESAVEAGAWRWANCPFTYTVPDSVMPPPQAFWMSNFSGYVCLPTPDVGWFSCWRSGNLLLLDWMNAEVTQTRNLADSLWESVTNRLVSLTNEASFFKVQPVLIPPPGGR